MRTLSCLLLVLFLGATALVQGADYWTIPNSGCDGYIRTENVDADPEDEYILSGSCGEFPDFQNHVIIYDYGIIVPIFEYYSSGGLSCSTAYDFDGDGQKEFIIRTNWGNASGFFITKLDHTIVAYFKPADETYTYYPRSVTDVDGDGIMELLVEKSSWGLTPLWARVYSFSSGSGLPITVNSEFACSPAAGTVPFDVQLNLAVDNVSEMSSRSIFSTVDIELANGTLIPNWKSGTANVGPGSTYSATFNAPLPATFAAIGDNNFTLTATDITAPPYNQPPYPASGYEDTSTCTAEGVAP